MLSKLVCHWTSFTLVDKAGMEHNAKQTAASHAEGAVPDFIVLVDDGHGEDDLLHLIVEIKGYRREDAKETKNTMDIYWVPGVNNLGNYGR